MNMITSLINQVRQLTLSAVDVPAIPAETKPAPVCDQKQAGYNEQDCVLQTAWDHYKKFMIGADGRPFGPQDLEDLDGDGDPEELITLSEGASYALQQAVWQNDKETFDKVWTWTQAHLQRNHIGRTYRPGNKLGNELHATDHLFAWRYFDKVWRNKTTKEFVGGVLESPRDEDKLHDSNPATDADLDIAVALLAAHRKWGGGRASQYKTEALLILKDIWDKETIEAPGRGRVLVGGAKQREFTEEYVDRQAPKESHGVVTGPLAGINTSYFRFADYLKILKTEDPDHKWEELFASSKALVTESGRQAKNDMRTKIEVSQGGGNIEPVDEYVEVKNTTRLNPDWSALTLGGKSPGRLVDHPWYEPKLNIRHGGDAFRLEYQIARLRDLYPNDQFALHYLTDQCTSAAQGPACFLSRELDRHGYVEEGYKIDGSDAWGETTKNTATTFVFFDKAGDRARATQTYRRLMANYNKSGLWGDDPLDYYDQAWAWQSLALARYGAAKLWDEKAPRHDLSYLPSMLGELSERTQLPSGFFHTNPAERFVSDQAKSLTVIETEAEGWEYYRGAEKKAEEAKVNCRRMGAPTGELQERLNKKIWPKIVENSSLLWLINAGVATPRPDLLAMAVEYFNKLPPAELRTAANRFWLGKLAMVMAGEMLDDKQAVAILKKPPFCFGSECLGQGLDADKPSNESKALVYERIYKYLLADSQDPLMKGENLLMRGILALNQEKPTAGKLFAEAEKFLKPLYDKGQPGHNKLIKDYTRLLKERILSKFERPGRKKETSEEDRLRQKEVYKSLREGSAAAMIFQAQAVMMRAGKLTDEDLEYKELENAANLINQGARQLSGIAYVAAKRLMAEVLARQGFILKNQRKPGYQEKSQEKLQTAEALLKSVIEWKDAYDNLMGADRKPKISKYLKQEAALANRWYAEVRAAQLGDEESARVTRKQSLPDQLRELDELIRKNLEPHLSDVKHEPTLFGDANCTLGELQIRRAYALKDLDRPEGQIREALQSAIAYLKTAADQGNSPTKVKARVWRAKAAIFLAEYEKTRQGELAKLAQAENEFAAAVRTAYKLKPTDDIALALARAPEIEEVKNSSLSDLLAVGGEIRLKQGDFQAAVPWLDKALSVYGSNFSARLNLADIRNWQENYDEAIRQYGLVDSQAPRTRLQAELGRAEAAMHRDRDYAPAQVAGLKKTADEIVSHEPHGSYLILRAVDDLLAAYRDGRDQTGKPLYGEVYQLAEKMLAQQAKAPVSRQLQARLYLRWAEAAEWLKDTDDKPKLSAQEILRRVPKEVTETIAAKEALGLESQLLGKELTMRKDEETTLFADPALKQKIIAGEDPGLISRFIGDRIEAATLAAADSHDFSDLIKLLKDYLTDKENEQQPELRRLIALLRKKAAPNGYHRLMRKLHLQLADALLWDKQYEPALKQYQAVVDEDDKKYPLPAVDSTPIRAWGLFGLGEDYRYGGPVKKTDDSFKFYLRARDEARQIKGSEEEKNYLLSRIYLGLAKLADERGALRLDGREVLPADLLRTADGYKGQIYCHYKKAYRPFFNEQRANKLELQRDFDHPAVEETTTYYYNNQSNPVNEFRLGLTLTEPVLFDLFGRRAELDARVKVNTDFDQKSGSKLQAYVLGGEFKPYHWLSLGADFKLGEHYLEKSGTPQFSYLRNPDLQATAGLRATEGVPFVQGLSAVVSAGIYYSGQDQKLRSYYGNINYNAGRDTTITALQGASVALQVNRFAFPYGGGFPQRTRFSFPSLFYEIGLDRRDLLRLKLEAAPFYEYAVDYSHDGKTEYPKHNLGLTAGAGAGFNAWGYFKLQLGVRYETIYQDVTDRYAPPAERWLPNFQFYGNLNFRF